MKHGHDHDLASDVKRKVGKKVWNNYYKFAIVRNPWDRYLSIYKNRRTNQGRFKKYKTFKSWIYSLYRVFKKRGNLPYAFGDQLSWLSDENGKVLVDYVGRFENYKEEWRKICKVIKARKRLMHANKTDHKHYSMYYGDKMVKMVEEMAKKDIEHFGYTFEDRRK
jgi:hypothetical protein